MDEIQLFDDPFGRLLEAGLGGMWLVNPENICDWKDLIDQRPGNIVRVTDIHNTIKFVPHEGQDVVGCIAGWISEEA